jgi:ATP-dependent helicase/nuclease subunit A
MSDVRLTPEQADAVARRRGRLLVAANAGSGKTTVLVERFVRAILNDGLEPDAILAITYTDKAAGEMRTRVRARLLELGERRRAQDTEAAWISTIHGLCTRILRAHAVAAGLDPVFVTLDAAETRALRDRAFDTALAALLADGRAQALDLVAAYTPDNLRAMVFAAFDQLRSAGQTHPRVPAVTVDADLDALEQAVRVAALAAQAEIGPHASGKTVDAARAALERCAKLPGTRASALAGDACAAYRDAHEGWLQAGRDVRAAGALELIGELLAGFDEAFAAAKLAVSGLDFDDLQLRARDLLRDAPAIAEGYAQRFASIMVDEFQDTSPLQLDILDRLDRDNTFVVGDARQSIYGFRHASVALFTARREALARDGLATTLAANFRSAPALIAALNDAFGPVFGAGATPLAPGRDAPATDAAPVELLITDTDGWHAGDAPDLGVLPARHAWRRAEARLVAQRVGDLIASGRFAAREIAVLVRAATDLATYERALGDRGVATLASGGRGFWARQQVQDLTSYLAALVNPRDEASLLGVLASPLVGISSDGLALLASAARRSHTSVWDQLADPPPLPDGDAEAVRAFAIALAAERERAPRLGLGELLERVIARTRYDERVLTLPGGRRRLANVHKLIRLATEFEERHGRDVRGLVERANAELEAAAAREPDAPVDLAGLDAVRLMTIHAAKGLEFDVVVVADLGRQGNHNPPLLLLGDDGRVGLQLYDLNAAPAQALERDALLAAQREAEAAEERRVLYVACTRARELLVLSAGAPVAKWPNERFGAPPIVWLGPAFVPDLAARLHDDAPAQRIGAVELVRNAVDTVGTVLREASPPPRAPTPASALSAAGDGQPPLPGLPGEAARSASPVPTLSYTALSSYAQCPYRFYLERILRLPADEPPAALAALAPTQPDAAGFEAMLRGTLAHELLEETDLRAPQPPARERIDAIAARHETALDDAGADDLSRLVQAAIDSPLLRRVGAADDVRREHRFSFVLGDDGPLVNGIVDVLARERSGAALVVDYKTDAVASDADLEAAVQRSYGVQRRIYALAALRDGATSVEVCHLYLERPSEPVIARYEGADVPALQAQVIEHASGLLAGAFAPTPEPYLALCATCPGRAALCEHPPELTERLAPAPAPVPAPVPPH